MAVSKGDSVKVTYEGRLKSGEVFDKTTEDKPLEFEVGSGRIITGFDSAVQGMEKGEEKEIEISPEQGYGARKENLLIDVPRSRFPENVDPKKGMALKTQDPNTGNTQVVTVADVAGDNIKVDFNHPLAGKTLIFNIEVVEIQKKE